MNISPCPNPECHESDCAVVEKGFIPDNPFRMVECATCGYCSPIAQGEAEAIRLHNALCGSVAGWKLVPEVPTEDMLEAACEAADEAVAAELARVAKLRTEHPSLGKGKPISRGRNICQAHWDKQFYAALLAAAPAPPGGRK